MHGGDPMEERRLLLEAERGGWGRRLRTYARLSGPGWLQGAITLGGGSLASALYLGVLTGYGLLWIQVLAMLLGVIMLRAIGYVTLTTGEPPFRAIRRDVNPVLAWGWITAVLVASLVWCLPQFSLGTAAIQQNLLGGDRSFAGKVLSCAGILAVATLVIWSYGQGSGGIRVFERVLRGMVGLVVLCFFGVIAALAAEGALPWGEILRGFVPDPGPITEPAPAFRPYLEGAGAFADWWSRRIVMEQRDVMIAAAATAVGVNMTFLLPASLLKKGWDRAHRGLAAFDLFAGLLIPYVLATACVVVAAASQFHGRVDARLVEGEGAPPAARGAFERVLGDRLAAEMGEEALAALPAADRSARMRDLPRAERELAALLVRRDAFDLAHALEPLSGPVVARWVFGIGVLGMAISTAIILMLITGFALCEMFGVEPSGWRHRVACLVGGAGVLGPFVWTGGARFWLAVPASVFGMVFLPVAYWTFFLMMNSGRLLGADRPRGARRVAVNALMLFAAAVVTPASIYSAFRQGGWFGVAGVAVFLGAAILAGLRRRARGP